MQLLLSGGKSGDRSPRELVMLKLVSDAVKLVSVVCVCLTLQPLLPQVVVLNLALSLASHCLAACSICRRCLFGYFCIRSRLTGLLTKLTIYITKRRKIKMHSALTC